MKCEFCGARKPPLRTLIQRGGPRHGEPRKACADVAACFERLNPGEKWRTR